MDLDQIKHTFAGIGRRQAVAGFVAGAAAAMGGGGNIVAKKKRKKRKKCKKCPKVDRCPQQYCCRCDDNTCHILEPIGDASEACMDHCARRGATWSGAISVVPGQAAMCDTIQRCIALPCPIV